MYNKLFSKIVTSSVWLEPDPILRVWVTLIATMDQDGFAPYAAVGNLAHTARVSIENARLAVSKFESPDPDSSDPEFEGRRLERVPGGWMVLNSGKYRAIATKEIQREQTRERVRRHRIRNAPVTLPNAPVAVGDAPVAPCTDLVTPSEAEADVRKNPPTPLEGGAVEKPKAARKKRSLNIEPFDVTKVTGLDVGAWTAWVAYREARGPAIKSFSMQAAAQELAAFGADQAKVVLHSKANQYQGLVMPRVQGGRQAQPAVLTHEQREAQTLEGLKSRRQGLGLPDFRDPIPGETATQYRKAQDDAFEAKRDAARNQRGTLDAFAQGFGRTGVKQ